MAPDLVKNPSAAGKSCREVAFEMPSQPPYRRSGLSDDFDFDFNRRQRGRFRPHRYSICVGVCIGIFTITTILLILGVSYIALLRSGMPHVNVTSLNITNSQVHNSQPKGPALQLVIKVSNRNEKLRLLYGSLTVDVISADVKLEKTKVAGFCQNPQNDTFLDLFMTVENARVNPDAVNDSKSDSNSHEMVFDVYLSGTIGFEVQTLQMATLPFVSTCYGVKLTDVQKGGTPKCNVRTFAFRPTAN